MCLHVCEHDACVCLCDVFVYIWVCNAVFRAVLCCPFVCGLSVCDSVPQHVTVVSAWIFVCGMRVCVFGALLHPWHVWVFVRLCRSCVAECIGAGGLACLCIPGAARRSCVFVCDVYVSPSADGCPPLYVMHLSMRVSATCVGHVWAAMPA